MIVRAEARNIDELGQLVVARVQAVDGITRTLTRPLVHLQRCSITVWCPAHTSSDRNAGGWCRSAASGCTKGGPGSKESRSEATMSKVHGREALVGGLAA